jgi:glycosyltransferase involved in cell wall biosynthesis
VNPLLSVVIPVYNGTESLEGAVDSIRRQGYEPIEILVVDDGSTDGTADAAARLGQGVRYIRQENGGPSSARNRGLAEARGEWIGFLDVDDRWPEGKLAVQTARLAADPELQVVAGRIRYQNPDGTGEMPDYVGAGQTVTHVHLGSALFRRSAFERVGRFDEEMRYSEDVDWFLRAREANLPMVILEHITLDYYRHAGNMTRGRDLRGLLFLQALKKSLDRRRQGGAAAELRPWSEHREIARRPAGVEPLVSVIVPVYNGERFLDRALESAIAQYYPATEILIIDDGSTDGSAAVAARYPAARYIRQENAGVAAARNRGIAESRGEAIAFLDQDDLWERQKLTLQVGLMLQRPEVGCVLTHHVHVLEPGVERPSWLRPELLAEAKGGYQPSGLLVRRRVFDEVGLFRTDYPDASDVDWFFRARDAGVRMEWVPDVLVRKRVHAANASGRVRELHAEYLKVIRSSLARRREVAGRAQ